MLQRSICEHEIFDQPGRNSGNVAILPPGDILQKDWSRKFPMMPGRCKNCSKIASDPNWPVLFAVYWLSYRLRFAAHIFTEYSGCDLHRLVCAVHHECCAAAVTAFCEPFTACGNLPSCTVWRHFTFLFLHHFASQVNLLQSVFDTRIVCFY